MNPSHPPAPCLISVDIETAGPNPSDFAMLSLGACIVARPEEAFYMELQPTTMNVDPRALAVSGLSLQALSVHGAAPVEAMGAFAGWLERVVPPGRRPLLVGLNAPFDWMFVCDYFHRFLGYNPLGHAALDIKALFMGATGVPWGRSGLEEIAAHFGIDRPLTHHAMEDAVYQALLCRHLLDLIGGNDAG